MRPSHGKGGNGSSKFEVHTTEMGGWVRVYTDAPHPPDDLYLALSHSLSIYFRKQPHMRLRFVVPIQRDGNTVELHAWYDIHSIPLPEEQPPA